MSLIKYLSLSAFCVSLAGCASYNTETHQKVKFISEDTPSVTVSVDGEIVGTTNCRAIVSLAGNHDVLFSKPGYKSVKYSLVPFEDPDTGTVSFLDAVYVPELEEEIPATPVEPAPEPAADEPAPAPVADDPVNEPEPEVAEPDAAEPAPEPAPEEPEPAAEEPAPAGEPAEPKPASKDSAVSDEIPAAPVVPASVVRERTLKELKADLAELKRLRKLNLISEEEFNKRLAALSDEVSKTY